MSSSSGESQYSGQINQLQGQVAQLFNQIGRLQLQLSLTNPSGNYAAASDQFATNAGSLPGSLQNLPPSSVGPLGVVSYTGFVWTWTNAGGGTVSWTQGVVTYQGTQYVIPAGSTTSLWVYWQKSNPLLFQGSNEPLSLNDESFEVALNDIAAGAAQPVTVFVSVDGSRTIIAGSQINVMNTLGNTMLQMNASSSGAGGGFIQAQNDSNVTTIQIEGDDGTGVPKIIFPVTNTVAGKTLAGYLPVVKWGGGTGYLAVYT
jgi:hypothetical protein